MHAEGQNVQRCKDLAQMLLAVAEVVLKVIPLGLQRVDVLILYLPSRPTGGNHRCNVA